VVPLITAPGDTNVSDATEYADVKATLKSNALQSELSHIK